MSRSEADDEQVAVHEELTAGAALIAAMAAAWKWVVEEAVRVRSELPAIELTLRPEVLVIDGSRMRVRLVADWENKGATPIFVQPDQTEISAFDVLTMSPKTTGLAEEPGEAVARVKPLAGLRFFVMEPNANGSIDCVADVPADRVTMFRLRLVVHLHGWRALRLARRLRKTKVGNQTHSPRDLAWIRSAILRSASSDK